MPVYRGGWGHKEARARFVRELPVSVKNDDSVLWGEQSFEAQTRKLTNKLLGMGTIQGDYLVYGWKPFFHIAVLLLFFAVSFGITNLILILFRETPPRSWFWDWSGIVFLWGLALASSTYAFLTPYDRYVVFDRGNRLVHLPRWFSRKQDSIRWDEADFGIIDVRLGMFHSEKGTNLYVVKPPHSLLHQGYFNWWTAIRIHAESKQWFRMTPEGHYVEGSESVFRFIIDFMNQPIEQSVSIDYIVGMDQILEQRGNITQEPLSYTYFFLWLNSERLSTQPNWLRANDGRWQQIAPAKVARAGWFGLWGQGMYGKHLQLMPHLRGTRSDPTFHNDPEAPLPGSRWIAVEDGGTGELVGQPPEVIRAVLEGKGMPSKEQLAKTRLEQGGWPGPGHTEWYEGR